MYVNVTRRVLLSINYLCIAIGPTKHLMDADVTVDAFRAVMNVNVEAPLFMTKDLLPVMGEGILPAWLALFDIAFIIYIIDVCTCCTIVLYFINQKPGSLSL